MHTEGTKLLDPFMSRESPNAAPAAAEGYALLNRLPGIFHSLLMGHKHR